MKRVQDQPSQPLTIYVKAMLMSTTRGTEQSGADGECRKDTNL